MQRKICLFRRCATLIEHFEFNPANPAVLFALARLYWDGRGADQDEALALSLFAQADELGHSDAALFLA